MKRSITICAVVVLFSSGYARAGTWTTLPYISDNNPFGIIGGTVVGYSNTDGSMNGYTYDGTNYTILNCPGYPPPGHWTAFLGVSGNTAVGIVGDTGQTYEGVTYNLSTQAWNVITSPYSQFPYLVLRNGDGSKLVGNVWNGNQGNQSRAVLYDGSTWSMLQLPGAPSNANAAGISGNMIVGSYMDSFSDWHGFLYDGANYTIVDGPDGATSTALTGISGSEIVGYYVDASGVNNGLFYDGTNWTTLDMPGATATQLFGIEGTTILGTYNDTSGNEHGFVYTIPEPATLLLLGLGGLILRKRS